MAAPRSGTWFARAAALMTATALTAACSDAKPAPTPVDPYDPGSLALPASGTTDGWMQQAVYAAVVRSVQDTDADGVGDFAGLVERMDYIADTGAGVLLIDAPTATTFADGTRTSIDLTAPEPSLGGADGFATLVDAAHERGLRLAVTLYLNHVDRGHPAFVAAQDANAPERGYFTFAPSPATDCDDVGPNVPDPYGTTRWTYSAAHDAYYFHRFGPAAPDVDWTHPDAKALMLDAVQAWLDRGVDGIYLADAYAWQEDFATGQCDDTADSRALVADVRALADAAGAFVWAADHSAQRGPHDSAARSAAYVGSGSGGDPRAQAVVATGLGERLVQALSGEIGGAAFATLLDDLVGVVGSRGNATAILPTGHWDLARAAATLGNDYRAVRAMVRILATAPLVPWIYYGDEIPVANGQASLNDNRDLAIAPMPWTATEPTHGFTEDDPFLPLPPDSDLRNAALADADVGSVLGAWRTALAWRYNLPALARGDFTRAAVVGVDGGDEPEAFAWVRAVTDSAVLVVHNTSAQPKALRVDAAATGWPVGQVRDVLDRDRPLIAYAGAAQPSVELELARAASAILVFADTTTAATP